MSENGLIWTVLFLWGFFMIRPALNYLVQLHIFCCGLPNIRGVLCRSCMRCFMRLLWNFFCILFALISIRDSWIFRLGVFHLRWGRSLRLWCLNLTLGVFGLGRAGVFFSCRLDVQYRERYCIFLCFDGKDLVSWLDLLLSTFLFRTMVSFHVCQQHKLKGHELWLIGRD